MPGCLCSLCNPQLLDCPGEPKIPFDAWEKLFQNYLGGEEFSAERKRDRGQASRSSEKHGQASRD